MRPDRPDMGCCRDGIHPGVFYVRVSVLVFFVLFFFFAGVGGVSGAQTNESRGPDQYGWQQVYEVVTPSTGEATRISGTADRQFYDFGFKQIQISGRKENYWSRDCGWWYVQGESTLNITVKDAKGDSVFSGTSLSTTKGRYTGTVTWGNDDDPGEWTATVDDGSTFANFKLYVRGALNVSSISTNTSPSTGDVVTITANITDNAGNQINGSAVDNNGTTVAPTVTAYVTGSGENFVVTLSDGNNDGNWTGTFIPNVMGDHKIKVKASDGHTYWVDGSGSAIVSVGGTFPYASVFLSFIERLIGGFTSNFNLSSIFASFAGIGGLFVAKRRWNRG